MTPVARPGKIVAVGKNYLDHVREMAGGTLAFGRTPAADAGVGGLPPRRASARGQSSEAADEPILFMKPPSAVIAGGEAILLPAQSGRVDYEGELVVVLGTRLHNASAAEALRGVRGYCCGNDVTARDLQAKDGQWTRAKGFDTFAALGPSLATGVDPADLRITTRLNGELRQDSRTSLLITPVGELLAFISRVMTLEPGDAVFTGTPAGVGPLHEGDVVEVEIEGVGVLRNPVRRAPS